jgi:hypothetical protein
MDFTGVEKLSKMNHPRVHAPQSIRIVENRQKLAKLHRINIPDDYDTKALKSFAYVIIYIFHIKYLLTKLKSELVQKN